MTKPQEITEIKALPGKQTDFLSSKADIAIYGGAAGSAKTVGLLFEPLKWIRKADFGGVIFRRDSTQITKEGGLWDTSSRFYPLLGGIGSRYNLKWNFPVHVDNDLKKPIIGWSSIGFAHLQLENDKYKWQGTQIPYIGFDEITHFSMGQFFYMLSRNRSATGIPGYIRATCNPDPDSWVAQFLSWWIDQDTGFPIAERAGVLRWFIRVGDNLVWADTAEELMAIYGASQRPKSVTFIPAKITDNPILLKEDPSYLSNLLAQPTVDRARLLDGNWKIRASAGTCFRRSWFPVKPFSAVPMGGRTIRYWDRSSSVPSPQYPDPDWTVGLKVKRAPDGRFFVLHMERFRDRPLGVKTRIKNIASQDGQQCEVVLEGDPASAGDFEIAEYMIWLAGYTVRTNKPTKNKYERAKPVMSQAEAGNIILVEGDWNEAFLIEHENFSEDPKSYSHDDVIDCDSGAVQMLTQNSTAFTSPVGIRVGADQQTNSVDNLTLADLGLD